MATYSVRVPIAGYAIVEVEASSEKEAIKKAIDEATRDEMERWEALECIAEGNFFRAPLNRADAELIDDGEDEDEL